MIFNMSAGDNTSNEVEGLLVEFMGEVNETLTAFKSEINTMLTGFTNDMSTDITALINTVSSASGAVKSVQRGVFTPTVDEDATITINPVNPDKCLVILHREMDEGTANYYAMPYELTSTELKVTRSSYYYSGYQLVRFSWQVIEFY